MQTISKRVVSLACLMGAITLNGCVISEEKKTSDVGVCYYLDATKGNDKNDGRSASSAWKTMKNLDTLKVNAGEQILFKRGETFVGKLDLTAQGTAEKRIVIGAYGEGDVKPVLSAPDSSLFTIRVLNSNYVTVEHLEIINHGSRDLAERTGVRVETKDYGISHDIRLNDLYIHDVNGSMVKQLGGGSGIYILNWGYNKVSVFEGLSVEYCHIKNCFRNAILWSGGYGDRRNWHPNHNVVFRYNLLEEIPGDGIVPIGCDGAIIEYNLMRRGTGALPVNTSEAAAGIWPFASDNTIIRFNESCDHKAPWDGQGFDADYNCVNTVIEYNYSHNNYGGMALLCSCGRDAGTPYCVGTIRPVLRYNISIGDGIRPYWTRGMNFSPVIHIGGPVKDAQVYRNIIHSKKKPTPGVHRAMIVADEWGGYADGTMVKENIFYAPEETKFDFTETTNNHFEGNYYIGSFLGLPKEKEVGTLEEKYLRIIEDCGPDGLLQLLDSVDIAGGAKCHFVSKEKIEAFFDKITAKE